MATATKKSGTVTATGKKATVSGRALIAKSDCVTCHAVDRKLIGPSYKAVAKKYPATGAAVSKLVNKVINGGSGTWGKLPMAPHPQISKKEATAMVEYILSLD